MRANTPLLRYSFWSSSLTVTYSQQWDSRAMQICVEGKEKKKSLEWKSQPIPQVSAVLSVARVQQWTVSFILLLIASFVIKY